jgi:hypothetical protein
MLLFANSGIEFLNRCDNEFGVITELLYQLSGVIRAINTTFGEALNSLLVW